MAVREKTRDELDMKTLRELAALPSNKFCFDCGQRGPTYVNVTIGAFVCSACGGILRGLNPPHRVKSLTVCSYTEVEMDRIKSRGNEYCNHIWLGSYDAKTEEVDLSSLEKRREFMRLKYEEKKYYVDPREAIKKMKPRAPVAPNVTSPPSVTQSKSQTVIQSSNTSALQKSGALSQTFCAGDVLNTSSNNLFKELECDPFTNSKQGESSTDGASFADFSSAFGNTESTPASLQSGQVHNSPSASSLSSTVLTSNSNVSTSHKKPAPPPPDRYAALADLDSQLHQEAEIPIASVPPAIATSTTSTVYWGTPTANMYNPVQQNPFGGNAWPQHAICPQNPFQVSAVPITQHAAGPNAKPSVANGNVNSAFWSPITNQAWTGQFQNGQHDAFSKAPVVLDPWSQTYAVSGANPFSNGSFSPGQTLNSSHASATKKNPFL